MNILSLIFACIGGGMVGYAFLVYENKDIRLWIGVLGFCLALIAQHI